MCARGRLVEGDQSVTLRLDDGSEFAQGYYDLMSGGFASRSEGAQKKARPWRYQGAEVVVHGDVVAVMFIGRRPVVMGTLEVYGEPFLPTGYAGADPNRAAMLLAPRGPDGAVVGEIAVEAAGGGAPNVRVAANGEIVLQVGDNLKVRTGEGASVTITMKPTGDLAIRVDGEVQVDASAVRLGDGDSETHLMRQDRFTAWWTSEIVPYLATLMLADPFSGTCGPPVMPPPELPTDLFRADKVFGS